MLESVSVRQGIFNLCNKAPEPKSNYSWSDLVQWQPWVASRKKERVVTVVL